MISISKFGDRKTFIIADANATATLVNVFQAQALMATAGWFAIVSITRRALIAESVCHSITIDPGIGLLPKMPMNANVSH